MAPAQPSLAYLRDYWCQNGSVSCVLRAEILRRLLPSTSQVLIRRYLYKAPGHREGERERERERKKEILFKGERDKPVRKLKPSSDNSRGFTADFMHHRFNKHRQVTRAAPIQRVRKTNLTISPTPQHTQPHTHTHTDRHTHTHTTAATTPPTLLSCTDPTALLAQC